MTTPIDIDLVLAAALQRADRRTAEKIELDKAMIYTLLDTFLGHDLLLALGITGTAQWKRPACEFDDPKPYGDHARVRYMVELGETTLQIASWVVDDRIDGTLMAIGFSVVVKNGDDLLVFIANDRKERAAMLSFYEEAVANALRFQTAEQSDEVMQHDAE